MSVASEAALVGISLGGTVDVGVDYDPGSAPALDSVVWPVPSRMALTASPAPVFTPGGSSVPMTWRVDNVPALSGSAHFGFLAFSLTAIPGGIDLGILGAPGCPGFLGSLDIVMLGSSSLPTVRFDVTVPQPLSPGDVFYSQAIGLLPPTAGNPLGLATSNGVASRFAWF